MPLARETVHNKPLNGRELKEIIRQDFAKQLESNGLLTDYIGYGRIGYEIRLTLHLDNFARTVATPTVSPSRPASKQEVEAVPGLAAIEAAPLQNPSPDAVVDGTRLTRNITSPNAERVRAGLGVPIVRQQMDGSKIEETVKYPPDPTFGEGNLGIEDVSAAMRREWKQPEPTPSAPSAPEPSLDSATIIDTDSIPAATDESLAATDSAT
jgi:hypothetical protein